MANATKRFFSRKLAELNESKVSAAASKEIDEDLVRTMGESFVRRSSKAEEIRFKAKDTETLREHLKNIYKSSAVLVESLTVFRENLKTLNKNISAFRDSLEEDETAAMLRDTLGITFKVHERMVHNCSTLVDSLDKSLVEPIQAFVKTDIRDARYFNNEFLKVQLEYESGLGKLSNLKQKSKTDPKKFEAASQGFQASQQKFDQMTEESLIKLNKVVDTNVIDNTRRFMLYLGSLRDFFSEGNTMFGQMKVHLEKIEGNTERKKRDRSGTLDGIKAPLFADTNRLTQAYDDLVENLSQPKLVVLNAVENVIPSEDFESIIFHLARIHHKKGTGVQAIKEMIEAELAARPGKTEKWAVTPILSSNRVSLELLSAYVKESCRFYLAAVVGPTVADMSKEPNLLEINPQTGASEAERKQSMEKLSGHFQKLVSNICSSSNICPWPLRLLSQVIRQHSKDQDPLGTVAGLLSVHLFQPAVSFPEEYWDPQDDGVVLNDKSRKNLAYLSLILKEVLGITAPKSEFLVDVEQLREQHFRSLHNFLDRVSSASSGVIPAEVKESDMSKKFSMDHDQNFQVAIQQVDIQPILLLLAQHIPKIVDKLNERDAAAVALRLQQLINLGL